MPDPGWPTMDRSRLRAPRLRADLVRRDRLDAVLRRAQTPVVLIEAPAGYGKTTLARGAVGAEDVWYSLTADDADPSVFLAHLAVGLEHRFPALPAAVDPLLRREGGVAGGWATAVDAIVAEVEATPGGPLTIVLDDYHHLGERPAVDAVVQRFVQWLPEDFRLVVATRRRPSLPALRRWRAEGLVTEVGRAELAFRPGEVADYYRRRFGVTVDAEQAGVLAGETEGWPIAMQLIGLSRPGHLEPSLPGTDVFDYLGDQVLDQVTPPVRAFLDATCVLRGFDVATAQAVTGRADSAETLRQVVDGGLFCVVDNDGGHRYHQLFRRLLLDRLPTAARVENHRRAARVLRGEEALYHAFEAADHELAGELLAALAHELTHAGRYLMLLDHAERLPGAVRLRHPSLLVQRSHAFRLTSQYARALEEAALAHDAGRDDAERFDALAASVAVHLDTVEPAAAVGALRAAGRLYRGLDAGRRVQWRRMVAENRLNAGELAKAAHAYRRLGDRECPRVHARLGTLYRALAIAEGQQPDDLIPRSHRDRDALLAWLHALLGEPELARRHARAGLRTGAELASPIVSCVSAGRLGHALVAGGELDAARRAYAQSLRIADRIQVPRFRVEALIGLVVIAGRRGDVDELWRYGQEAVAILADAGDRYLTAVASLAIGGAAVLVGHPDAERWLRSAVDGAARCGDEYVRTVGSIWLAELARRGGHSGGFASLAAEALRLVRLRGNEYLLTKPTLFGLSVGWLSAVDGEYARYLRARVPGEAPRGVLYVQTLGSFAVYRDGVVVPERAWIRRKARELLWLLCSREPHAVRRSEASSLLWPGEGGSGHLRVVVHALRMVLDPARVAGDVPRFLHTSGDRLVLDASVRVDSDEFLRLSAVALRDRDAAVRDAALLLYRGSFLADAPHVWLEAARSSLRARFVELGLWAASEASASGDLSRCVALARRVVGEDPYEEAGYRVLASAYAASGDVGAARAVYEECRSLVSELGVWPSWSL